MKKYFYLLALVCATGFLASCSEDDGPEEPNYETVDFEGEYWNAQIDTKQYGGKLLYGETGMGFTEDNGVYEWTNATTPAILLTEAPTHSSLGLQAWQHTRATTS